MQNKVYRPMQVNQLYVKPLGKGASLVGTGIVIGEGVYQYVNAECAGDRMDAVASTVGALAGMYAGAEVGAAAGTAARARAWRYRAGSTIAAATSRTASCRRPPATTG